MISDFSPQNKWHDRIIEMTFRTVAKKKHFFHRTKVHENCLCPCMGCMVNIRTRFYSILFPIWNFQILISNNSISACTVAMLSYAVRPVIMFDSHCLIYHISIQFHSIKFIVAYEYYSTKYTIHTSNYCICKCNVHWFALIKTIHIQMIVKSCI